MGTVAVFSLVNPHTSIEFDVRGADGQARRWSIELGSASSLRKADWNEDTLEIGHEIEVVGAPAKDGSPAISGQHEARITLVDGRRVVYQEGRPVWLKLYRLFGG